MAPALAQWVCTTSKARAASRPVSRPSARRSLAGRIGARSAGSMMTSSPAARASSARWPARPVMMTGRATSGGRASAPRSAMTPAPPSSRVMTVATRSGLMTGRDLGLRVPRGREAPRRAGDWRRAWERERARARERARRASGGWLPSRPAAGWASGRARRRRRAGWARGRRGTARQAGGRAGCLRRAGHGRAGHRVPPAGRSGRAGRGQAAGRSTRLVRSSRSGRPPRAGWWLCPGRAGRVVWSSSSGSSSRARPIAGGLAARGELSSAWSAGAGPPRAAGGRPGHADRLDPAVHLKLAEDAAGMGADGVRGDHQLGGDLAGALALGHAGQHVELARAERCQAGCCSPWRPPRRRAARG